MAKHRMLLDLFCGEGGAGLGYFRAGFRDVIGIDMSLARLRRYPFDSYQMDWRDGLEKFGNDADVIHASPPCQHYSRATVPANKANHPDLVPPVQLALLRSGKSYVIENVKGAPLIRPVELCGCMFGMATGWNGQMFGLYRPRLFESNVPILVPGHEKHDLPAMPILGHGVNKTWTDQYGGQPPVSVRKHLMGCDWMTRDGLAESIPPIFTEFIGLQLMAHLDMTR